MRILWLLIIPCTLLVINVTAAIQEPTTTPDVTLQFSKSAQNNTFLNNSTIQHNLVSVPKNDTEVEDLLVKEDEPTESTSDIPKFVPNPSEEDNDIQSKNETEWIEDGSDTEEQKMNKSTSGLPRAISSSDLNIADGHVAAIIVMSFLLICSFAYVGLLMWRKYLESRYGSREMLVNEDEFIIDPNDMKHFSI